MARAKRHYIPGQVWHVTHRCHQREFLLKFAKDKRRWIQWLFESKRRYGLTILNYVVTSNHIHLLVVDDGVRETIPKSIQLTAGRCAQEYNLRKKRKGAYWEDRYHAAAIESGKHFLNCLVYIDLNMVRAGIVEHPSEWEFGGFNEIRNPRRKSKLIAHDQLVTLSGCASYASFLKLHDQFLARSLEKESLKRQGQWSESVAVGGKEFIKGIKAKLGGRASGRQVRETSEEFELREESCPYAFNLRSKKEDICLDNMYFWSEL